ncbi:MAG: aromatic ring-hydroxylating dioxygenase subunit alpha, partial [Chitinophagaceae bacterium]|nr:aromatic ring-hydroxylating dioxygenase subunit alpha [Chitinophagaceae bacterium]
MLQYVIDTDISRAITLHKHFYTDVNCFEESKEKIFASTWQFAGDDSLIHESGTCYPFTLLPNFLDEPLLLTKDNGEIIHCLSN